MRVVEGADQETGFDAFIRSAEPKLRQALVATYGPVDGREATVDALSWAWENWDRLSMVQNRVGYLYRVGQSATRRFVARDLPLRADRVGDDQLPDIEPGLVLALNRLSVQQRTVVVLVCGFGWRHVDVAEVLEISPPTVRTHLARALDRLRDALEAHDAR
jgi:DNA-directed RNA polymerase specialized sigma24 family protein